MKRIFALTLAVILVLSAFASCKKEEEEKKKNSLDDAQSTTVATDSPDESGEETSEPVDDEEIGFEWVVAPGTLSGDIQPLYDMMTGEMLSVGVSLFKADDGSFSLVNHQGESLGSLDHGDYNYCSVCGCITDHRYIVDPENYSLSEDILGHGGAGGIYIYDESEAKVYESNFGGFYEVTEPLGPTIVCAGERVDLDEEEQQIYGTDFIYKSENRYGILIGSELKVPCEYEASVDFDHAGIAALCKDGKWGYFNIDGERLLENKYEASAVEDTYSAYEGSYLPYQSSYGFIAVKYEGLWGYCTSDGVTAIEPVFLEARPVYENRAWVKTDKGWGVIELDVELPSIGEDRLRELLAPGYQFVYLGETEAYGTPLMEFESQGHIYHMTADGDYLELRGKN